MACRSSTLICVTQKEAVFGDAKNLILCFFLLDTFQSLSYCLKKFKPRPLPRCMCTQSSFNRVLLNKCQEKDVLKNIERSILLLSSKLPNLENLLDREWNTSVEVLCLVASTRAFGAFGHAPRCSLHLRV